VLQALGLSVQFVYSVLEIPSSQLVAIGSVVIAFVNGLCKYKHKLHIFNHIQFLYSGDLYI